jgi:methanethiol S-methyltransferase
MVLVPAVAYGGFLAVVLWTIAFVANVNLLTTINGPARSSWRRAAGIDLALLGPFALHH